MKNVVGIGIAAVDVVRRSSGSGSGSGRGR